jgi:TatA/E family protein of Tat protein translocase
MPMAWGFGTNELLIVLAVALLLFGGRKLPELARSLGRSINEFRRGIQDVGDEIKDAAEAKPIEKPKEDQNEDASAQAQPEGPGRSDAGP